jgi:hypothetical protein
LSSAEVKQLSSDASLMLLVRSGDLQAMGERHDRYSPLVCSVALRVLGDTRGRRVHYGFYLDKCLRYTSQTFRFFD